MSLAKSAANRDCFIVRCSRIAPREETGDGGRHPLPRRRCTMPDTAEARPDVSPDTIEFHTAQARTSRAHGMRRLMRRLWGVLRRRPAIDTTAVAPPAVDIDRLGETLRQPLTSIRSLSELL